jgi:cobalamin biosynthesis protein CobD/CbiB
MSAALLVPALLLDAAFGEPKWLWSRLPHPAVVMGRAVGWLDARLNADENRKAKGVLALLVLVFGAGQGALRLHNPSGHDAASQCDAHVAIADFARFFAGRGIWLPGGPLARDA